MFINHSNHPSEQWDEAQRKEAESYGTIMDMPFPAVNPTHTSDEVQDMVNLNGESILKHQPSVVMVQGEFTYTYKMVEFLKKHQIKAVAATSERLVKTLDDGKTKQVVFNFVQFREF